MGLGAQEAMSPASMAFCVVPKWEKLRFLRVPQLHAARHIPGGCTRREMLLLVCSFSKSLLSCPAPSAGLPPACS